MGKQFRTGRNQMIPGLGLKPTILLFGWIPFWWCVALISLYRMKRNDKQTARQNEADAL